MTHHIAVRRLLALLVLSLTACTGVIGDGGDRSQQQVDPATGLPLDPGAGADTGGGGAPQGNGDGPDASGGESNLTPGGPDIGGPDTPSGTPPCDDAVRSLNIRDVALYQSVKIPLVSSGVEVQNRNASVVAGRQALVRVFVDPQAGFEPRTLIGRLTLSQPGAPPKVLEQQVAISTTSDDAALSSTFNFDLTPEQVGTDTRYTVSLHELSCPPASAPPASAAARVPASGDSALDAQGLGGAFRVVLVPVRYQADGSNRAPAVDAQGLARFRDHLFSLYPITAADVTVRAPMNWDGLVLSDGTGWSELLDQCVSQRDADGVEPSTYYYCMFNPAASFGTYCDGGCVAGLGFVPSANDQLRRVGIGLGFGDAAGTMAHELGHTLGRPHAPCGGVAGPDPRFPYSSGGIGSWGYNVLTHELFSPDDHTDLMGYCGNPWISDYNYELVFQRLSTVTSARTLNLTPVELLSVVVDADLSLRRGHLLSRSAMPDGEQVATTFFDGSGAPLANVAGRYVAVTHVAGGIVYLPQPPVGAVRATLTGFGDVAL